MIAPIAIPGISPAANEAPEKLPPELELCPMPSTGTEVAAVGAGATAVDVGIAEDGDV